MSKIIRCSSTDRVLACGASLRPIDAPYHPNNPEAVEGHAGHECMPRRVTGEGPTVDEVADRYALELPTIERMVDQAVAVWETLRHWYPNPACEQKMDAELGDDVILRGTTDLISTYNTIAVLDWKFGYSPSEHPGQVKSYAYLARETYGMPPRDYILGAEVWVRSGEARIHKFANSDLDRHRDDLLQQAKSPNQFGPGFDACRYCPHALQCQARADYVRSAVSSLVPIATSTSLISRETVANLYDKAQMMRRALEQYDELLKQMLDDGPLDLSDGRKITMAVEKHTTIQPSVAMRVLREDLRLNADEADQVLKISKTGLSRVMQNRMPKRQGAKGMRMAMGKLRDAGALGQKIVQRPKITGIKRGSK